MERVFRACSVVVNARSRRRFGGVSTCRCVSGWLPDEFSDRPRCATQSSAPSTSSSLVATGRMRVGRSRRSDPRRCGWFDRSGGQGHAADQTHSVGLSTPTVRSSQIEWARVA